MIELGAHGRGTEFDAAGGQRRDILGPFVVAGGDVGDVA